MLTIFISVFISVTVTLILCALVVVWLSIMLSDQDKRIKELIALLEKLFLNI
jgi:hypothetical protein